MGKAATVRPKRRQRSRGGARARLGAPVIFLGVSLPEDNFHAPNERLDLGQLWRGVLAAGELLLGLGSLEASGPLEGAL